MTSFTRRQFLAGAATAPWLMEYHALAASMKKKVKIRDMKVIVMQGPDRNYTYVKIETDAGPYGIGEGYGSPGVGVKEQILSLKPDLVGKLGTQTRPHSRNRRRSMPPPQRCPQAGALL
jgi:L-alanine-DL-glutamate epimerase-like enolase superfamily enzyme